MTAKIEDSRAGRGIKPSLLYGNALPSPGGEKGDPMGSLPPRGRAGSREQAGGRIV